MNWADEVLDTSFPVWVALLAAVLLLGVRAAVLLRRHARATPVVVPAPELFGLVRCSLPQHPWRGHHTGYRCTALTFRPENDARAADLAGDLFMQPTERR